ncbi:MAG: tetratricopeptide repeat-containing sensor histidine kinase [Cyclobacteriaceae bacterium]|nr:tetratricopeptide repeat-containing sensor histidine kinase [Cyclobacteriaceae bacterium]
MLLRVCFIIGFIFYSNFGYAQNQSKADSLILIVESSTPLADSIRIEMYRSIFISHTNQDTRIKYAQKVVEIAQKSNNLLWLYRSYLNIGHAYRKKGELKNSLDALFHSLEYAKEMDDARREAIACTAIGDVYAVESNHKNALAYYNLGIVKFREINDSINLAKNLLNTGDFYLTLHKLDSALLYFNESGQIFNLKNHKIGKAYNLGNIGLVYAEQGKHILAEKNIVEATKILQELGDNYPIAVYNTYMADIYKAKGDLPRALEYAQHSYSLAMADGLKEQIRDASHILSELYQETEEYKKAYHFQELYLAYRDSINNEETIRKMADLRTEYEVSQKQIEVDLLNQKHKTNKIIGAGLLGVILLIGALAYMLNKRNKEKRQANKLLTAQKEQLQIQHKELGVLNTTKDRFFSIISHDLRGPVNSFKGLTSLMKMSLEEKKYDELPKMTGMLDEASNQISILLNNLLDWAINQQGEFPYSPEDVELAQLVKEVLDTSQSRTDSKQIEIKTSIKTDVIAWIDKNSIKTVLRNLINNALKFTPQGGKIEIYGSTVNNKVILKIKDTGIGISKDKFASLFSMNELRSTPGTDGEKGLGLGLRLAYEFVKMNKGSITAESEEGKGATFTVRLPAKS